MHELVKELEVLRERIETAMSQIRIDEKRSEAEELERRMAAPDFWDNPQEAAKLSKKHADFKKQVEFWSGLLDDVKACLELGRTEDHNLLGDLEVQYSDIKSKFEAREYELKLNGRYDSSDAIVHVHAGTGGTDAQDWAQMLVRMYLRYAEKSDLSVEVVTESPGEEAGIKSAILKVEGQYAYGRLKSEHGVHRLVRQSPFNADNLRQTSFALVEVTPDMPESNQLAIDDKDLRIDVYRSGGKGGQGVNTTDSAVRITHIPTGVAVAIQNERSQLQNKETAMKILRARLLHLQQEQRAETMDKLKGPTSTEQWGKQIRNYVLHPYTLVKDTRTGYETGDADRVLNGDLDDFLDAYLTHTLGVED